MKDVFGQELNLGDFIVYGSVRWEVGVLRVGMITKVNQPNDRGYYDQGKSAFTTKFYEKNGDGVWFPTRGRSKPEATMKLEESLIPEDLLDILREERKDLLS